MYAVVYQEKEEKRFISNVAVVCKAVNLQPAGQIEPLIGCCVTLRPFRY